MDNDPQGVSPPGGSVTRFDLSSVHEGIERPTALEVGSGGLTFEYSSGSPSGIPWTVKWLSLRHYDESNVPQKDRTLARTPYFIETPGLRLLSNRVPLTADAFRAIIDASRSHHLAEVSEVAKGGPHAAVRGTVFYWFHQPGENPWH